MTIQTSQSACPAQAKRPKIAWFIAAVGLLVGVVGFSVGHFQFMEPLPQHHQKISQVVGESMAPSLMGAHFSSHCPNCQIQILVPLHGATPAIPKSGIVCWHCGASVSAEQVKLSGNLIPGDQVRINDETRSFELGDMVAINVDGRMRVKRILGLPGDIIVLDGTRLRVQEKSFPTLAPLVRVDSDRYRSQSRWLPGAGGDASHWKRVNRTWEHGPSKQINDWLCYHHFAVYRQNQASPVMDDYPINSSIVRRLNRAEHLAVEVIVHDDNKIHSERPIVLETLFWNPDGVRVMKSSLIRGASTIVRSSESSKANLGQLTESTASNDRHASPIAPRNRRIGLEERNDNESDRPSNVAMDDVSRLVAPTHPIAIRFAWEDGQGYQGLRLELNVFREIEYRVRPQDDMSGFPLRLAEDQYFVVGDNVPVSVDSRTFGPIDENQLIGKVEPISTVQ
ncbi:S26 family signal peptidase [Novipirellula aureliae]|nr:S26 family signal peptidase [Novipirellula aureliae]